MAVGTPVSELSPRRASDSDGLGKVVEYDRYIEAQLRRTRRQVKNVDIASSLMLLAVGFLGYLMAVALADHWIVAGGLGFVGRVVAFSLLAAGVLTYIVLRVVPLVMRRINPVYAAYTIERHRPGIKNGLINFLLLRNGSDRVPGRIYEAMEAQAVNALTGTQTEVAVDRTPVIRLLLAMVAILICVAFYTVFSPKNPFTSAWRVISPWSNVAPPTRVSINDIQPGDGSGFHDQHVKISAQVGGLRAGEEAIVHFSTRDGQVVDRPVPMTLAESGYRHSVELPPDNLGLQQDLEYWITAGDAISPHFRIKVDTAPTIVLEEIEYQYPAYSELPPRKVARHGDIQALEGTRVTLRAKANQPITQANLDFECDGRNDLEMRVDGRRADVSFVLAMNEKTRRGEHESYQLRFRNADGHENPKPIRYSIEVIADLPPEVEFVGPELDPSKDLVVPPEKPVRFSVQAADPDFKLAGVKFHARRRGSTLVEESLLAAPRGGEFHRDYMLDLKRLALKPGEQIEFWAAADDNRRPKANHAETSHYHLRIATPDEQDQQGDNQNAGQADKQDPKDGHAEHQPRGKRNENDQQGNQGEDGQQQSKDKQGGGSNRGGKQDQKQQEQGGESGSENNSRGGKSKQPSSGKGSPSKGSSKESSDSPSGEGDSESGEGGQGKKQGGQKGPGDKNDSSKRLDPERDAGKAIEEINKHFNQKEKQSDQPKQEEQQQAGQQSEKISGNKGQQDQAGSKAGQEQQSPGGEDGEQGKQGGEKQDDASPGEGGTSGGREGEADGAQKQAAGKQSKGNKSGKQSQQQAGGGEKSGQEDTADKPQAGKKQGDEKHGEQGPLGEKKQDEQQGQGERSSGENQGAESHGEKPHGDKQAGQSGKQGSSGDQGAEGSEKGTPNEGGDNTKKDESGGGKQGDAKIGDEDPKRADQETRPRQGQGGKARGAGETDDKMKKHEGESPEQKGGDQDSPDKGDAGAGNSDGGNKHGAPTMQAPNQKREKKQISPDNKKPTSDDEPEMASEDKKQSDSQGGQEGDRDGGGKSGGGQRSNSEGTGSAGQNSEADQGGSQGETQGKGPTGSKGGNQQKSDKPTGGKSSGEKGPGTNQGKGQESDRGIKADSPETADPRGHTNESRQPAQPKDGQQPPGEKQPSNAKKQKKTSDGKPQANSQQQGAQGEPKPSDRGGNDVRGGGQRGNPTQGGQPGADDETISPPPPADDSEPGGEDPNLEYARKATDLALERLKDQLAKDQPDPELLKKLKWTREDMERFRQQWERLRKSADEAGPKGDAARQEFDDALRSLGLRPRGASLSSGQKRDDREHNLREDRRAAPPPEYLDQFREFRKSTAKSRQR